MVLVILIRKMMSDEVYHIPVLLKESIDGLNVKPDGVYVDVTFGGGGHSRAILEKLGPEGRLFGFDQDEAVASNVPEDDRFTFVPNNFEYISNFLRYYEVQKVDGILADLGVSSRHFDDAERGFSLRSEGALDMRMDQQAPLTAAKVLNEYEHGKLSQILREYGEVRESGKLAAHLLKYREGKSFETTADLLEAIEPLAGKLGVKKHRFQAQVFQAIRIEVNREMEVLQNFLEQTSGLIKPGGRLVVISYHSLEDRPVKNFMKKGKVRGEVEKDFFGNPLRPFEEVTKKPIVPSDGEQKLNTRSTSAKLRIAERTTWETNTPIKKP